MKSEVNMKNWLVTKYGKNYNLEGTADKHPKLGMNTFVAFTSELVKANLERNVLIYETQNTIYKCPLKFINLDTRRFEEKKLEDYTEDNICEKIIRACIKISQNLELDKFEENIKKMVNKGKEELIAEESEKKKQMLDVLKENVNIGLLRIYNSTDENPFAYRIDTEEGIKEKVFYPFVHSGMFQDSVLYSDEVIDFRYFPQYNGMDTYAWSENLEKIIVENHTEDTYYFNNTEIKSGDKKTFKRLIHKEKTLF